MTHYMFDGYGVQAKIPLDQIHFLNETLNLIALDLGVQPIAPAYLLPYDYGVVPRDEGISCFLLFSGGHLTIHTFPLRGCYFVDFVTPKSISQTRFLATIQKYWPSQAKLSRLFSAERDGRNLSETFSPNTVFGPHVMATLKLKQSLTLEQTNRFLEGLIKKISMTPITRAFGLMDHYQEPNYLTSMIMIAESHLSVHIDIQSQTMYFDIFSCKMFDYSGIEKNLNDFGVISSFHVVPRGQDHDRRSTQRKSKSPMPTKTKKALNWWKDER